MTTIQPVILSGGSGTRLWPLSREHYPKQLLPLATDVTMLQATALRLGGKVGKYQVEAHPIVICNEEYRFITAEQLRAVGKLTSRIVLEPFGRNTAPALTLAALVATQEGEDPILLVMPADHVIQDTSEFANVIAQGMAAADQGCVITFGIVPTRPETGYGYIHYGALNGSGHEILQFVEKPNLELANQYVQSGTYLWNSGLFMMRASVWLKAIDRFCPEMFAACRLAVASGKRDSDFYRIDAAEFEKCPSDSIDYAVMEKLSGDPKAGIGARVFPMNVGWSDVGAWDALWEIGKKDSNGNVIRGDVLLQNAKDNLVFAQERLVACVGVENLVVVETQDAVMVAEKSRLQEVKQLVAQLKSSSRKEAVVHRKTHRPWGWYDSIDHGERFQVKRIVVKPGASLSLQMHHHRAEHWIIVKGTARITRGDEVFLLSENQSTYIPLGVTHRLENPGKFLLEMIEVQSGSYLGEDDIVRFEDTYGRN
jgi:mannose-1-phosphate guanylyltransferase/mannose-6-phosphate isomerase